MAIRSFYSLGLLTVLLAGCANAPRQYDVSGAVTFQGRPVADGQIVFEDEAPAQGKWPAPIQNGRYQLKATAGSKLVRISASEATGKMLEGGMGAQIPERRELIPPQFNTQSQEKRTIEPKQPQTIDFELK